MRSHGHSVQLLYNNPSQQERQIERGLEWRRVDGGNNFSNFTQANPTFCLSSKPFYPVHVSLNTRTLEQLLTFATAAFVDKFLTFTMDKEEHPTEYAHEHEDEHDEENVEEEEFINPDDIEVVEQSDGDEPMDDEDQDGQDDDGMVEANLPLEDNSQGHSSELRMAMIYPRDSHSRIYPAF